VDAPAGVPGLRALREELLVDQREFPPEYWTKAGAWNTGLKVPDWMPGAGGLPIYVQPDLGYTRLKQDMKDMEDFMSGRLGSVVCSPTPAILSAPAGTPPPGHLHRTEVRKARRHRSVASSVPLPRRSPRSGSDRRRGRCGVDERLPCAQPDQDRESVATQLSGGDEEAQAPAESWLRFGGAVRTLTPKQRDNEARRQLYEGRDALKRRQERDGEGWMTWPHPHPDR
jgi:hypothetical protein